MAAVIAFTFTSEGSQTYDLYVSTMPPATQPGIISYRPTFKAQHMTVGKIGLDKSLNLLNETKAGENQHAIR